MENLKIIVKIIVIIGIILIGKFFFLHEFKAGSCIKDNRDGYIWQVNNFSFGKYQVMGWQNNVWGNAIKMGKTVLERKDIDGIKIYNETRCPRYEL